MSHLPPVYVLTQDLQIYSSTEYSKRKQIALQL